MKTIQSISAARLCRDVSNFDLPFVGTGRRGALALVPFGYIWRILREVIEVAPQYENAVHVTQYGWMAVAFAVVAVLTYIAG